MSGNKVDMPIVDVSKLSQVDINKIKSVIDKEFDLEILLKQKDINAIQNEIGKAEAQLTLLKKYYEDKEKQHFALDNKQSRKKDTTAKSEMKEPNEYSKKYTQLLSILSSEGNMVVPKKRKQETVYSPVSSGYMQTRSQSSSLRPVARMRPSTNSVECRYQQQNKCICRRSDNVLVSLQCPKCGKTDFLSPQGFINHCRIAHMIDILSHDHAAMTCGTLLPKEEQDDDGLEALEKLEKHGLDPAVNLNKPDLEEYARTNKQDPLATMNVEKFGNTGIDNKRRKPGEALSPTAKSRAGSETASSTPSQPPAPVPQPKKQQEFNATFSHLKDMFGRQVPDFDGLVSSATEKVDDVDGEDYEDEDEDETGNDEGQVGGANKGSKDDANVRPSHSNRRKPVTQNES